MALFAKKKNEKDKKEFYQLFFFYHFSEKIQLSFLYPVYIRLLNILCVYFKIFSDKKMFQVGTFKLAGKSREFTIRSSLKDLYSPLLFQRNSLDIINSF